MAKAKKPIADDEDTPKSKETAALKKIHAEALKRYKKCCNDHAEKENRRNYSEDMRFMFVPGAQWEKAEKDARGNDRTMYEFNEARVNGMSVINHMRANKPAAKIRGVEEGDKQLAEIRQGLYLNITNNSDFDSTKDYAASHQVGGGYAVWRVDTQYSADTAFDQDITIQSVINPLCVRCDPSDKTELKTKAKYWFVETKLDNEDFDELYPKADRVSFEVDEELDPNEDEETTWVAEYWRKVPTVKNICLLSDGKTIDKATTPNLPEGVTVVKEKKLNTFKIESYIISGDAVLKGPMPFVGTEFPFVPVYGFYVVVEGKVFWCGLTRYEKDPQRALNWAMTSVYESIGDAPKAKYWATPTQAKGHAQQWAEANAKNLPVMLYNNDPEVPGPPPRVGGADVPVALIQAAGMARDALKASVGIFNASLGATSNETSGKAIRARQDEGMVATFNFGDNMAKAEKRTCEIINGMIPHIYDTERNIRILGQDGAEKYLKINARDPVTGEVINDMSAGKFDFTVTTGPSFATQRQEAAEFYTGLSQTDPTLMAVAGDLIIKSHDYPMADAIAERKKLMLPPQIQAAINKDKPIPPEAQAALMQAEQAMAMVQEQGQLVQQAQQEAQTDKAAAEKAKADVQIATANLKVQEANLAADVAKFQALVAKEQLAMGSQDNEKNAQADRDQLSAEVQNALVSIQQQAAEYQAQAAQIMEQYAQAIGQMIANAPPPVVVSPKKTKVARSKRVNGEIVTTIEETDETGNTTQKQANSRREGDEMVTTIN
jgi:hypothetical protein